MRPQPLTSYRDDGPESSVRDYVMTDVVGSTRLWQLDSERMDATLAEMDVSFREIVELVGGVLVRERGEGDSHFMVFRSAKCAVLAASKLNLLLETNPVFHEIKLRTAIHRGESNFRSGDYYGTEVIRCARIRALAQPGQILVSAQVRDEVREDDELSFISVGSHRLKGFQVGEEIFQLVYGGLKRDFPAIQSPRTGNYGFPVFASTIIGRQEDSFRIRELIRKHRLTAIVGPGGVGKTRVASDAAVMLGEEFEGGAWFVDLTNAKSIDSIWSAIFAAFGTFQVSDIESLGRTIGGRSTLIVLDNCEHVVEELTVVVVTLLQALISVRIVATSRKTIRVPGGAHFRLSRLATHSHQGLPDAVTLFLERVPESHIKSQIRDTELEVVADLCRKLDGLPLAIEIVASWTELLTVRQITNRLEQFLDREGLDQHRKPFSRTVAAAIESSCDMLSSEGRELLQSLAYFPASWTIESTTSIASETNDDSVEFISQELLGMSLVLVDGASQDSRRFRMLETTRQVLLRKGNLASKEWRGRFIRFFSDQSEMARQNWAEGKDQEAMSLVEVEYDSFIRALEWSALEDPNKALLLAMNLRQYWLRSSRILDGVWWFKRLDREVRFEGRDRSNMLSALASFQIRLDDLNVAEEMLLEASQIIGSSRDFDWAKVTCNLGTIWQRQGDLLRARNAFQESYEVFHETGHVLEEAVTLINLGVCMMRLEEPLEECIRVFRKSAACGEATGSASMQANAYSSLAEAYSLLGDHRTALQFVFKSIELYRTGVWLVQVAWTFVNAANLLAEVGALEGSAQTWFAARRLAALANANLSDRQERIMDKLLCGYRANLRPDRLQILEDLAKDAGYEELTNMVRESLRRNL